MYSDSPSELYMIYTENSFAGSGNGEILCELCSHDELKLHGIGKGESTRIAELYSYVGVKALTKCAEFI